MCPGKVKKCVSAIMNSRSSDFHFWIMSVGDVHVRHVFLLFVILCAREVHIEPSCADMMDVLHCFYFAKLGYCLLDVKVSLTLSFTVMPILLAVSL